MSRELAAGWVDGWVVSRGTSSPAATPWGLRVQVGVPRQYARYVMLEAREQIVRDLVSRVRTPSVWLKAFVEPSVLKPWLTPAWSEDAPAYLMATDLNAERVSVPGGYSVDSVSCDGVIRVVVSSVDGSIAAKGQVGIAGDRGVVDQVSTEPAHQRRGLGTVVLRSLANLAIEAGAGTGILGATVEGRALYESLGWKVHAPLAGFVYQP